MMNKFKYLNDDFNEARASFDYQDRLLYKALKNHFLAHIEKHFVNAAMYFESPVAVAEHSDIIESISGELEQMAAYSDQLEMLEKYFGEIERGEEEIFVIPDNDWESY